MSGEAGRVEQDVDFESEECSEGPHSRQQGEDRKAGARQPSIVVVRPAKPLTPARCGAWVRKTVAANMPLIVEGFLNQAAKGGCAHLKMAAETVAAGPSRVRREKGSAELMLEELERPANS